MNLGSLATDEDIVSRLRERAIVAELEARVSRELWRTAMKNMWVERFEAKAGHFFGHGKPIHCMMAMQGGTEEVWIFNVTTCSDVPHIECYRKLKSGKRSKVVSVIECVCAIDHMAFPFHKAK